MTKGNAYRKTRHGKWYEDTLCEKAIKKITIRDSRRAGRKTCRQAAMSCD